MVATGRPTCAPADPRNYPWLLRCFLCDAEGTQISPNFDWRDGAWQNRPRYLDHNWSWRPYFYQITGRGRRRQPRDPI
ncbi:EAL-associated domain-containing protein [Halopseudomonas pachastrellae]|nr:EAL-associated domain-containing protein [Halopseudomonas pachastrellae]